MKKTVPTLAASTTAIGTSVLGLVIVRPEHDPSRPPSPPGPHEHGQSGPRPHPTHTHTQPPSRTLLGCDNSIPFSFSSSDMTSTATCTVDTVHTYATPASFSSPYNFTAHQALRSTASAPTPSRYHRSKSDNATPTSNRNIMSKDTITMKNNPKDVPMASSEGTQWASGSANTHHSWMKRLSTLSTSSSSRQSSPRPESLIMSHSNGSVAFSNTGSATPMLSTHIPSSSPASAIRPNKLVKRSTSLRGTPVELSGPGSKIPKPTTLRRPATSHQRSATMQERRTRDIHSAHDTVSRTGSNPFSSDVQWRSFFTPKLFLDSATPSRRRNSTSIPNPIRRIYPDRRYRPILTSASEPIARARVEFDDESNHLVASHDSKPLNGFFSSPPRSSVPVASESFRPSPHNFSEPESQNDLSKQSDTESKRSSFIGDWLPGEGNPWRRSLSRASMTKYRRKGRSSPSESSTASDRQSEHTDNLEPPNKRRDVAGIEPSPLSIQSAVESSPVTVNEFIKSLSPASSPITANQFLKSLAPAQPSDHTFRSNQIAGHAHHAEAALDEFGSLTLPHISRQSTPSTELCSDFGSNLSDSGLSSEPRARLERDNVFDSDCMKTVKNSPGRRGPAIDTIFQESPPQQVHGRHTLLRDILRRGSHQDQPHGLRPRHSIIHEEDALTTPPRSSRQPSALPSPLPKSTTPDMISSSPPDMPSLLELRHRESFFDTTDDDQESSWSFAGDDDIGENGENGENVTIAGRFAHLALPSDLLVPFSKQTASANNTPQRSGEVRSSIFDWSEQQPFDRSPGTHSPPRPKTVHGKKDAETRGSRPSGRRPPSGAHVRSQSVPVVPEADGKRGQVTNKFGTWGVGSKGVTEDWNEDFDFEDDHSVLPIDEKRLDSGVGMLVPRAIQEQQTNVLANIGLLRDWGLLIEEIKELRMRAITLELFQENKDVAWNEVEAMIDLADQESDEHTLAPRYSPPSSPSFNYDDFDEPDTTTSAGNRPTFENPRRESPRRQLHFDEDMSASPPCIEHGVRIIPATPQRARKNSEAIARHVIEALQSHRASLSSDSGLIPGGPPEKVHFDTATLRRIIPYVQDLRDRVKRIIREAEGLYSSPRSPISSDEDPSFSKIFRDPPESPSTLRKTRRPATIPDNISDDDFPSANEELAMRLRFMTVV